MSSQFLALLKPVLRLAVRISGAALTDDAAFVSLL